MMRLLIEDERDNPYSYQAGMWSYVRYTLTDHHHTPYGQVMILLSYGKRGDVLEDMVIRIWKHDG